MDGHFSRGENLYASERKVDYMPQTKVKMKCSVIFLCIVLYASVAISVSLSEQEQLSVYDVVERYDFPVGILPKGAIGYDLNEKNGQFTVYFNGTCIFGIQSYELKYKSTIKGVISKGRLSKLKGISVKVEVLWLKIVEVARDGDDLQFSVGIASAAFTVDSFAESPQCGCGFDCNNFNLNGDVSSL
ncbi:hypothetical protein VNO77_18036 [Canavalia gladiata]|uniref:Uncharacterized protein n=1 Tax=Canavalia gladiata TaxID=3824 RepID=A0AAN9QH90_CANGL